MGCLARKTAKLCHMCFEDVLKHHKTYKLRCLLSSHIFFTDIFHFTKGISYVSLTITMYYLLQSVGGIGEC